MPRENIYFRDKESLTMMEVYLLSLFSEIALSTGTHNRITINKISNRSTGTFRYAIYDEYKSNLGKATDSFEQQPASYDKTDAYYENFRYANLEEALQRLKKFFSEDILKDDKYSNSEKEDYLKNLLPDAKKLIGID